MARPASAELQPELATPPQAFRAELLARPPTSSHLCQFYEDDPRLLNAAVDFLSSGLAAGEACLVIATPEHRGAFVERLRDLGFDVDDLAGSGRLRLLDAADTLASFMVGSSPDWERFASVVGPEISRCRAQSRVARVRAFGEMVDLLWRDGRPAAALSLEEMWNEIGRMDSFSLLCAYSMGNFYLEEHSGPFRQVCDTHSHVLPAQNRAIESENPALLMRELSELQQRARALESELERRKTLERELEAELAHRKEIERALLEADRAKDEFLALLGHEMRNPLAPILTAAQLMKLRDGATREQQIIERQARYLTRLVDDLLDVSRITRGQIALRKETIELSVALARAIETSAPIFEQRGHLLSLDVPNVGLAVDADAGRLAQVFANLLTNAAKYTEPRGNVAVRARVESGLVVVSVKDDGMGIPADLLPRVFDLFSQERRDSRHAMGGLGIGLALVKSLVALHGGSVEARSAGIGRGSEFVVRLPQARTSTVAPSPAVERADRAPIRSTARRVLIVDDNVEAAELLAEALRDCGYEVAVAHDGPSAIEVARSFEPATALLDIGLPVMDGYELAERIREALPRPARLIALTGYGQASDKAKSLAHGFELHLVKPVDLDQVTELLERVS